MRIAYDVVLRRPACPLLQAIYGGDTGIADNFPCEVWLIDPTPDLHVYIVPEGQLDKLIAMTVKPIVLAARAREETIQKLLAQRQEIDQQSAILGYQPESPRTKRKKKPLKSMKVAAGQ